MRPVIVTFIVFILNFAAPAYADSSKVATPDKKLSIGFIYVSPVATEGFSYSHDIARVALGKKPNITTFYVDNISEGADAEEVMAEMARNKTDIIIATSYGFMDATEIVSKQFPEQVFLHCSGDKVGPNLSSFFGRIYQARYLTGMTAGLMTSSNIIGYVAAYPIPEVVRGINAFTLGVQAVNPKAQVNVIWTRTWYDPVVEGEATLKVIESGADVVTQHQDSFAVQCRAAEKGVYTIGYHSDMSHLSKDKHLVSAIWNWLPFYEKVVENVQAGTWESGSFFYDIKAGVVDISEFGKAVPQNVREQVLKRRQELIDGSYVVFSGPVVDTDGEIIVPAGEVLPDEKLFSVDWFVKGIVQVDN